MPQAAFVEAQGEPWESALDEDPGPAAGPYMFEAWRKGESLSLVPNPEWRGDVAPTLERLVFRFLPDSDTVPDAMRNGDIDAVLAQAQLDLMQDLESVPGLQLETVLGPSFEHLVLNTEDPVVGDLAVRRAIALGLNRPEIVEALVKPFYPEGQPLGNMVLRTHSPRVTSLTTRRTRARTWRPRAGCWKEPAGWRAPTASGSVKGSGWSSSSPRRPTTSVASKPWS